MCAFVVVVAELMWMDCELGFVVQGWYLDVCVEVQKYGTWSRVYGEFEQCEKESVRVSKNK